MTSPYGRDKLSYPWSYRTLLEQTDSRVFVSGDPSEATDCTWYVIQVTSEERLKLWSGLLAGLDLLYPDEFISLSQIWLQATEYPNDFPPQNGDCTVNLCDLILQCIQETPELQQAIGSYSSTSNITTTTPPNATLEATPVVDPTTCDNDNLFGAITELVDKLNQWSEDILEIFVNAPFALARLGDIIEAIPFVGEMPADDSFQFVESFLEDINDAYQAAYTTTLRDEFRCDLFCLARDTCDLDFEDVRDYFYARCGTTLDGSNPLDLIEDILANNWIGAATVDVMHFMLMSMLTFGERLFDVNLGQLHQQLNSIYNDPDGDWITLCTECNEYWESILDFTESDYGIVTFNTCNGGDVGEWQDGVGLVAVNLLGDSCQYGADAKALYCTIDFDDTEVNEIEVYSTFTRGTYGSGDLGFVAYRTRLMHESTVYVSSQTQRLANEFSLGVPTTIDSVIDGLELDPVDKVDIYMRPANNGSNGSAVITQIILRGEGTKPSQLP